MFLTPGSHAGRKRFGGVITSNSSTALAVGPFGTVNPVIQVDASTALSATGIKITGAAAGGGVVLQTLSSGTNEAISIAAKGNSSVTLSAGASGSIFLNSQTRNSIAIGYAGVDSITGMDLATAVTGRLYANSGEVFRWTQTLLSTFATLSAVSDLQVNTVRSIASAASPAWNDFQVSATTTTVTGNTHITGLVAKSSFFAPVLSAASALTVDNAVNVYIDGPPTGAGAGPATVTNAYSFYVASGISAFLGQVTLSASRTVVSASGAVWTDLQVGGNLTLTGTTTVNEIAKTNFLAPSITDSSSVTVTQAETIAISGAPTAAGSVTITNTWALKVIAGNISLPASGYLNFSTTSGTSGYGIRDNSGTIEIKNSGGSWAAPGAAQGNHIPFGHFSTGPSSGATGYYTPGYTVTSVSTSANTTAQSPLTRNGTLKNLYVRTFATQSGTGSLVITVQVNGADTGITITVAANDTAQQYSDLSHTQAITAGDRINLKAVNNASATATTFLAGVQFD